MKFARMSSKKAGQRGLSHKGEAFPVWAPLPTLTWSLYLFADYSVSVRKGHFADRKPCVSAVFSEGYYSWCSPVGMAGAVEPPPKVIG
jgi:hypothetical protein